MAGWMNRAVLAANKGIGWMGTGNSWVAKQMGQVPRYMAKGMAKGATKHLDKGSKARAMMYSGARKLHGLNRWAQNHPKETTLGTASVAWWALGD